MLHARGRTALVGILLLLSITAVLSGQRPSFRSAIDLVLLHVTVLGPGGRFAGNLSADDFEIFDEGQQQELTFFAHADAALSASLVIDTSSSMDEEMAGAQQAALDFIGKLRPRDVAQVVSFDSRVEILQPLTSDRPALESAIRRLKPGGATSLYNAVYIVLQQLAKNKPSEPDDIRRQVIVVLSDGEDTSSLVSFDQLVETAKRSQTVIYAIGLGLEDSLSKRSEAEFTLRQLTNETGGRLFLPKVSADLLDVYTQIANELRNQYVIGFLSDATGGWRRLNVRVRQPNLQARTRAGYYAMSARR